jgi:DNA-3-methyladenine glycosylase I
MTAAALPCDWAPATDALYRAYHDTEWGVPVYESRALWEKLQLDGMQAGLSWITILRKRDTIRAELDDLNPERLAGWTEDRIARALTNPGIIRSVQKVTACVGNARIWCDRRAEGEDFAAFCWSFVDGQPIPGQIARHRDAPTQTDRSVALAKALKAQGYKFVGPTIVYAWMQAVGMYNDHEICCPRYRAVAGLAR